MPHDRDALPALVEKVRAAKGPDREIDARVQCAIANEGRLGAFRSMEVWVETALHRGWATPRYTASHDAARALVERILPRWKLGTADADPTRAGLNRRAWAKVEPFLGNDAGWKIGAHEGFGATVPLAILAALLTSLLAQAEAEAGGQP